MGVGEWFGGVGGGVWYGCVAGGVVWCAAFLSHVAVIIIITDNTHPTLIHHHPHQDWPAHDFVNYTGFAFLIFGCMYLGFPAVRIVHELYGDRLSPKTRFYPGLYTFFR